MYWGSKGACSIPLVKGGVNAPPAKTSEASLLREATRSHDESWLAAQIRSRGFLKSHEERRKPKGGTTVAQVSVTAADTLAEGEFNRFYARGLCARAADEVVSEVEVYRGKPVSQPRPESQAMIGKRIPASSLLRDLGVSQGVEPALGLPPGPNSGLTVRLPTYPGRSLTRG